MSRIRIFITALGIVSPVGCGAADTLAAIRRSQPGIEPLKLFPVSHTPPLPVGEISTLPWSVDRPRTHTLALMAAREAMKDSVAAPEAIIIGTTTGGISVTEDRLRDGSRNPDDYALHALGSVAECLALETGCRGPLLTVSTACSSGATALKIAADLLRSGAVRRVLAGGADSLCRLTYYGFNALQLVDDTGARPFDRDRHGMSVGEGAALFLLTAAETPPEGALAELLGGGVSCDAWHPATPHPEGRGALAALTGALDDAGITPEEIDYIHLHGTATIENDRAEARAVGTLFGDRPVPPVSSTKGALGHSLAAAGSTGVALAALSIAHGLIPGNQGLRNPDPDLALIPVTEPLERPVGVALVNAFGFGGNNTVLVLGRPGCTSVGSEPDRPTAFNILGRCSLTGAGTTDQLIERIIRNEPAAGLVSAAEMARHLSEREARRMKRLQRLAMTLAISACGKAGSDRPGPSSVFFGTGWGALTETHDFLMKLFDSADQFTSPIDFIGSVHNAASGQVAIHYKAEGANIATTGGDCAFEQALMAAGLLTRRSDDPILVLGADEYQSTLTPLFDRSAAISSAPADGGGALYLRPATDDAGCRIRFVHLAYHGGGEPDLPQLIDKLGGARSIGERYGAILAGLPLAHQEQAAGQLASFLSLTGYARPVIDYRRFTGEFGSASAVAAVLGAVLVETDALPDPGRGCATSLGKCGILILGFGDYLTAMEVMP